MNIMRDRENGVEPSDVPKQGWIELLIQAVSLLANLVIRDTVLPESRISQEERLKSVISQLER